MDAAPEDVTPDAWSSRPRTLAEYEREALGRMGPEARGYIEGGAGNEITLADNVAAWQRWALRPRVLVGASGCDPSVTVLGVRRPHPLIVAPTAFQRLAHPEGEVAMARAAAATGTVMCVSTFASDGAAAVAERVPEVARWFQLYALTDRGATRELIDDAARQGYEALVVTVDRPVLGIREREWQVSLRDPVTDIPAHDPAQTPDVPPAALLSNIDPDLRWPDIERFAADSELPVLVKGILTPEDAELAIAHGAAGVVVSNHGGRQLDTVLSGVDALAPIVDAVAGRIDVLVDGGIRRGTDVVKALALGARAVLIGRPMTWGLAVAGAAGAQHVLETLLGELVNALVLVGCPRAADLNGSFVTGAPWTGPIQRPRG
ncbi:MAG TPA: alpha-hydroxy acid oxidase [Solirubrobacteraceae bacterium]|jgi:isopentenyl diphosphate isomerase/L-lactate dehydrogenase-like FMN-dependent dehydrogenase|nr:alpha-hydroxy acid oxidase [Solirubrobacteraceae bacterium]